MALRGCRGFAGFRRGRRLGQVPADLPWFDASPTDLDFLEARFLRTMLLMMGLHRMRGMAQPTAWEARALASAFLWARRNGWNWTLDDRERVQWFRSSVDHGGDERWMETGDGTRLVAPVFAGGDWEEAAWTTAPEVAAAQVVADWMGRVRAGRAGTGEDREAVRREDVRRHEAREEGGRFLRLEPKRPAWETVRGPSEEAVRVFLYYGNLFWREAELPFPPEEGEAEEILRKAFYAQHAFRWFVDWDADDLLDESSLKVPLTWRGSVRSQDERLADAPILTGPPIMVHSSWNSFGNSALAKAFLSPVLLAHALDARGHGR